VALGCSGSDASGPAGTGGVGGVGGAGATGGEGGTGGIVAGNCHSSVPGLLSQWGLFKNIRDQIPEDDVIPFNVTSPLFTDYALKPRFVTLRGGGQINYTDPERWQSPVGTIYVKTFAYPPNELTDPPQTKDQLIETRLLVHDSAEDDRLNCLGAESCWNTHVYVYNEAQTDAICESGGVNLSVTYTDPLTDEQITIEDYHVPVSPGECGQCHGRRGPATRTLGPSTGMLNRGNDYQDNLVENQIDELYDAGWLAPRPPSFDMRTTYASPVELIAGCMPDDCTPAHFHEAARSFLDTNCAHCHAPDGEIEDQGLFLDYATMDPENPTFEEFNQWGVCRTPTSAGNLTDACRFKPVDIWPGDPDNSLLLCRLESVIPGEMMPTLGRSVKDTEAIAIIRQWIIDLPTLFPNIPLCGAEATN
jgi:uncharacterized repeat protein (TIGR03806 family)